VKIRIMKPPKMKYYNVSASTELLCGHAEKIRKAGSGR
jgi:hypothetical protein